MRSAKRLRLLAGLLLVAAGFLAACASSDPAPDQVHVLTWKGDVNPIMARYIERGISEAEDSDARAVVIELDTPGGLDSAMRDIIQDIEASQVPVIVYVSPAGGRAASAGTFITMAGHVAAMAPSTTIGAATPINSTGDDIEGALGRKVTNDAVAYIRGIAELRGRNPDWAESAVRDAVAVNQNDAVTLDVVDFVAVSLEDLLQKSNGRLVTVSTDSGATATVPVRTEGAAITRNDTTLFEKLLDVIATPDIAFLLITLGGFALISEIFHPSGVMGIFGVLALVLAYFSLGALPTNWAGVALIAAGFILIAIEIFVPGFGAPGIGGTIGLILGGLILFSGSDAELQVSRWLVFGLALTVALFLIVVVGAIVKARRVPPSSGRESLLGLKGRVVSALEPRGVVLIAGERWDATADDPPLEADAEVLVTAVEGLKLRVKRDPASVKLLPAANAPAEA